VGGNRRVWTEPKTVGCPKTRGGKALGLEGTGTAVKRSSENKTMALREPPQKGRQRTKKKKNHLEKTGKGPSGRGATGTTKGLKTSRALAKKKRGGKKKVKVSPDRVR